MARKSPPKDAQAEKLPAGLSKPEGQDRVVSLLHKLVGQPPQVLLLEGGCAEERLGLGLYWAALLNCPDHAPPCLTCSVCRLIQGRGFRDLHVFTGTEEAIKIGQVREVRTIMGQPPDHGAMRVILIHEAQEMTSSAANSLLKAMEEPQPGNVFVLLAPLRSWLLPTLVSRSLVLTLSWSTGGRGALEHLQAWEQRMIQFWRTGRGLFELTSKKGEVTRNLAHEVVTVCQHSLLSAMHGEYLGEMSVFLAQNLDAEGLSKVDRVLDKAHQALNLQTTPALVVDWVGVQVWSLMHGARG
jgi:DNA polymerase-3 subunit delta'